MDSLYKTICRGLGAAGDDLTRGGAAHAIRMLLDMGFLERVRQSETYKIPMLYRDGLNITQGKAFQVQEDEQAEEDDED